MRVRQWWIGVAAWIVVAGCGDGSGGAGSPDADTGQDTASGDTGGDAESDAADVIEDTGAEVDTATDVAVDAADVADANDTGGDVVADVAVDTTPDAGQDGDADMPPGCTPGCTDGCPQGCFDMGDCRGGDSLDLHANIETIGVLVRGGGRASGTTWYRSAGSSYWTRGHDAVGIDDGRLATSLFWLQPATDYEVMLQTDDSAIIGCGVARTRRVDP
ncbi:MAG: hypothetical protein KDA28_12260, partial [Phycisphaerales bacterium]|nr:hypothetical protein [Phycisphaerales bacterium]